MRECYSECKPYFSSILQMEIACLFSVGPDKVTSKRCDDSTGDFKYELNNVKGDEHIVTEETQFECKCEL